MNDIDENLDTGGGRFAHLSPSERRYLWRARPRSLPETVGAAVFILGTVALVLAAVVTALALL